MCAAEPHGTSAPQRTTFPPDVDSAARSASVSIPSGLPGATTISSVFVVNTVGVPSARPASVTVPMFFRSADANTSADAPSTSCVARVDEPS